MMLSKPIGVRQREAWQTKAVNLLLDQFPRMTSHQAVSITTHALDEVAKRNRGKLKWGKIRKLILLMARPEDQTLRLHGAPGLRS